jgi:hypothetical protein
MKKQTQPPEIAPSILEVIENQMRENNPPIVKKTYNRLIKEGHSEDYTRRLIAYAMMVEMNDMLKTMRMFDVEKYTHTLNRLPELDLEED